MENNTTTTPHLYTEEQLMARLKFFIGICLSLTLTGIVFVVLYSLIFVTQPLNAISPIDQKFFELIVPIATFLTGTLSGIMLAGGDKDAQKQALTAATKGWDKPPSPTPTPGGISSGFNSPSAGASTFGAPQAGGFGTTSPGFGAVPPASTGFSAGGFGGVPSAPADFAPQQVVPGFGGKMMPPEAPQPLL